MFHTLQLAAAIPETAQAVRLRFAVPKVLREQFAFKSGQFVTLRVPVSGLDLRRSYSICSTPAQLQDHGTFDIGVKAVNGGVVSPYLQTLQAGHAIDVLAPDGRFVLPAKTQHVLCIAAGSGITPLLAMLADRLANDSDARFTLLYGNRNTASTLFLEDLYALKNRYRQQLDIHVVMSRQASDIALHNGRMDAAKLTAFLTGPLKGLVFDHALVCGPNDLIDVCEATLPALGVGKVHSERFGSPTSTPNHCAHTLANQPAQEHSLTPLAKLTIMTGGLQHSVPWLAGTPLLLDAGLAAGLDLPYACKGGVCCTCRAKVVAGVVSMDKNYTLEADEVAAGFVLTCQCRAVSAQVVVSYDER